MLPSSHPRLLSPATYLYCNMDASPRCEYTQDHPTFGRQTSNFPEQDELVRAAATHSARSNIQQLLLLGAVPDPNIVSAQFSETCLADSLSAERYATYAGTLHQSSPTLHGAACQLVQRPCRTYRSFPARAPSASSSQGGNKGRPSESGRASAYVLPLLDGFPYGVYVYQNEPVGNVAFSSPVVMRFNRRRSLVSSCFLGSLSQGIKD